MAELYEHGDIEILDLDCHVGMRGGIIIPLSNNDEPDKFISMSPLEAKALIEKLSQELQKYKKALDGNEEDLMNAA